MGEQERVADRARRDPGYRRMLMEDADIYAAQEASADTLLVEDYWGNLSALIHDPERIADLTRLSDAATPGPWIRAWNSFDVHHMGIGGGGPSALRSMEDIDFAVACVSFVRDMLSERFDILDAAASEGRNVAPDATDDEAAAIEAQAIGHLGRQIP